MSVLCHSKTCPLLFWAHWTVRRRSQQWLKPLLKSITNKGSKITDLWPQDTSVVHWFSDDQLLNHYLSSDKTAWPTAREKRTWTFGLDSCRHCPTWKSWNCIPFECQQVKRAFCYLVGVSLVKIDHLTWIMIIGCRQILRHLLGSFFVRLSDLPHFGLYSEAEEEILAQVIKIEKLFAYSKSIFRVSGFL